MKMEGWKGGGEDGGMGGVKMEGWVVGEVGKEGRSGKK